MLKKIAQSGAVIALALALALGLADRASADGSYPYHVSYPKMMCLSAAPGPILWGGFAMYKTPGFGLVFDVGSGRVITSYSSQWLVFNLWAGYVDSAGKTRWIRGKAIAGRGHTLGSGLSPSDAVFEMSPGNWVPVPQSAGVAQDHAVLALPDNRGYSIYAEYTWGAIYNEQTGAVAYPQTTHFEYQGVARC